MWFALLAPALAGGVACWCIGRSLPASAGTFQVQGVARRVEIVRDRHAVPHISAESEADAQFALGFVHAQDRLWQLELNRRVAAGTLAAILGPDALEEDRFFRTLGVRAAAARELEQLDGGTREALDAYARGVNAGVQALRGRLPPEFILLRCAPEPWTPLDSVAWLKIVAWGLGGNWASELERLQLSERLSREQLAELWREAPLPRLELDRLYGSLAPAAGALLQAPGATRSHAPLGSNNWVVDGSRSRSGRPLLANDPHLDLTAPALWYLAHLHTPDHGVIGATVPGLPGVILGRNEHVAWAFTNTESDTQDLFIERLTAHDPAQYETPSGPRPFERRRELIEVKGRQAVVLDVRSSRHGPILSDAAPSVSKLLPPDTVLALAWAALEPGDRTLQFPLAAGRARNGAELAQAARDFHVAQQNIVYADGAGDVGFIAAGRIPLRSPDNELKGKLPAPGWLARYDWQGWLPFAELPRQHNPATGRIVTANQDITPPGYAHWLTSEWAPPYRAERIAALLDAEPRHDVHSFASIQLDVSSGIAAALLPLLLQVEPGDAEQREILERLRSWSLEMSAHAPEPLIFAAWVRELGRVVCEDELGDLFEQLWSETPELLRNVLRNEGGQGRWCDDIRTPAVESCALSLRVALQRALEQAREQQGPDWTAWRWGHVHRASFEHMPFSGVPLLSGWFGIELPVAGDGESINVAGYSPGDDDGPFISRYGAGYRAIYDLAEPERSVFVSSTGQSGNPASPHYRDLTELWGRGAFIPMSTRRATYSAGAIGTVVLEPRSPAE